MSTGSAGRDGPAHRASPFRSAPSTSAPSSPGSNGSSANTSRWWRTIRSAPGTAPAHRRTSTCGKRTARRRSPWSTPTWCPAGESTIPRTRVPTAVRAALAGSRSGRRVPGAVSRPTGENIAARSGKIWRTPSGRSTEKRRLALREHKNGNRADDLSFHGIRKAEAVWWNLSRSALLEQALRRREGHLAASGPLVVRTGEYTGRPPNDRFFVREPGSEGSIHWGKTNRPFAADKYESLRARLFSYLEGRELFVQDCHVGADEGHRLPIRVITAPGFHSRPEMDGTRSEVFILIHFGRKEVLIGGTLYAGEIKKSIFTVMNYLLPAAGVLPMHCAASYGRDDRDVAVLFGLSGTGKTTLSADPERTLVGDDEHGWSDRGVFNFEGGCYAKVIRLSPDMEPEIHRTTGMFGTILENVGMDTMSRRIDLDDATLTENTRASYPLSSIPRVSPSGSVGHPRHIVMLTADAFGVLPPISAMTKDQAMYHFLSGYTAKVAGTERGVVEPQATFSACFGAPFMALPHSVYAKLLGEKG